MEIATLIPAYKTKYIAPLFRGLITQTRPSTRVIVSDDSPNEEFSAVLQSEEMANVRARLNIEIHRGPQKGAYENFKHLVRLWKHSTPLVHLLLDDDVIFPAFYARHATTHASGEFSCSISARWTATVAGQPVGILPVPHEVSSSNDRVVALHARALFTSTVLCGNWLGEFSNCVLSENSTDLLFEPEFAGVSYAGLWDLGAFLAASQRAPVAYILDCLGYFRTSGENHSADVKYMKAGLLAHAALALGGERLGQLDHREACRCYRGVAARLQQVYAAEADVQPLCDVLPRMANGEIGAVEEFEQRWADFLTRNGF
jgi:hypothetical protein